MKIFKRDNKIDNPVEESSEVVYTDLMSALVGGLGNNTEGTFVLDLRTEDNQQVFMYIDNKKVKYAYNTQYPLSFSERMFWVLESELPAQTRNGVASMVTDFQRPDFYAEVVGKYPESKPVVDQILRDYTISALLRVKNSPIKEIYSEELPEEEKVIVSNTDFMEATIEEIFEIIEKVEEAENDSLLSFNLKKDESIALSSMRNKTPETDVENLVLEASASNSTISDLRAASSGFLFIDVLSTLQKLSEEEYVDVEKIEYSEDDFIEEVDTEEKFEPTADEEQILSLEAVLADLAFEDEDDLIILPEIEEEVALDTDEEVALDTDEESEEPVLKIEFEGHFSDSDRQPVMISEISDDWEFEYPPASTENSTTEDDGGFDFIAVEDDDLEDGMTRGLNDESYDNDLLQTVTGSASSEISEKVIELATENSELEYNIVKIEKTLPQLQERYQKDVANYQGAVLISTLADEKDELVETMEDSRLDSHDSFFELYIAEEERFNINEKRKNILSEISGILETLEGDYVQSMIHRTVLKIEGTEGLSYMAFQDPNEKLEAVVEKLPESFEDVEVPAVFEDVEVPAVFEDVEVPAVFEEVEEDLEEEVVDSEGPREHYVVPTDVPIFEALVKEMGFNPLEEWDRERLARNK